MKSIKYLSLFLLPFFATDVVAFQVGYKSEREGKYVFSVELEEGLLVNNIVLTNNVSHGKSFVELHFREDFQLEISRFDSHRKTKSQLGMEEYVRILTKVKNKILSDKLAEKVDSVVIGFNVIYSMSKKITDSVKKQAAIMPGKMKLKDPEIHKAIRNYLKTSEVLTKTCRVFDKSLEECEQYDSFIEQVGFSEQHLHKTWREISLLDDGGLHKYNSFWVLINWD